MDQFVPGKEQSRNKDGIAGHRHKAGVKRNTP